MLNDSTQLEPVAKIVLQGLDASTDALRREAPELSYASMEARREARMEPLIAYIRVREDDQERVFFVSRHDTFMGLPFPDGAFITYRSPVGKIASHDPGDVVRVRMPDNHPDRRFLILETNSFDPCWEASTWDACKNQVKLEGGRYYVPSFRGFLKDKAGGGLKEGFQKPDLVKVALRDQLLLDKVQDEVFRRPVFASIVLTGTAGTGKTTVLVKRIGMKRDLLFKTREEEGFDPKVLEGAYSLPAARRWILFTPTTDLLAYLKEALSKEQIAAPDEMVKTWENFSLALARDFQIVGPKRLQLLKENRVIQDAGSLRLAQYTDELRARFRDLLLSLPGKLGGWLRGSEEARKVADEARIERLVSMFRGYVSQRLRGGTTAVYPAAKALLLAYQNFLKADPAENPALRDFERLLPVALELWRNRAFATLDGVKTYLVENYPGLRAAIAKNEFGIDLPEQSTDISSYELDSILCVLLELAADHAKDESPFARSTDNLNAIYTNLVRTSVYVDEAPDFSAVQLRCMRLVSHPMAQNVFAVGDLMQRLSPHGLGSWKECAWAFGDYESHELKTVYRHSSTLFELSKQLYGLELDAKNGYDSSRENRRPVLKEYADEGDLKSWLVESIVEAAERFEALPSMAIFVEKEEDIDRVHALIHEELFRYGMIAEKCPRGKIASADNIKIMTIDYIKGLEFECVFIVDIDLIATRYRDFAARALYLGATRAASVLGVAYGIEFPDELAPVRHFFDKA